MTGILTEQKLISYCRCMVIESSSLVPVLFREVFSQPYISFFHLLVNGFSVIYIQADPITLPCSLARAGTNLLLVNEKRRCRDEFPITLYLQSEINFCQDDCQRLMLHPYTTASRTVLFQVGFRHWTPTGL